MFYHHSTGRFQCTEYIIAGHARVYLQHHTLKLERKWTLLIELNYGHLGCLCDSDITCLYNVFVCFTCFFLFYVESLFNFTRLHFLFIPLSGAVTTVTRCSYHYASWDTAQNLPDSCFTIHGQWQVWTNYLSLITRGCGQKRILVLGSGLFENETSSFIFFVWAVVWISITFIKLTVHVMETFPTAIGSRTVWHPHRSSPS